MMSQPVSVPQPSIYICPMMSYLDKMGVESRTCQFVSIGQPNIFILLAVAACWQYRFSMIKGEVTVPPDVQQINHNCDRAERHQVYTPLCFSSQSYPAACTPDGGGAGASIINFLLLCKLNFLLMSCLVKRLLYFGTKTKLS